MVTVFSPVGSDHLNFSIIPDDGKSKLIDAVATLDLLQKTFGVVGVYRCPIKHSINLHGAQ